MSGHFAIANISTGTLNALVKILMKQMDIIDPAEAVRRINSGEWIVTPAKPQELPVWETIIVGNIGSVSALWIGLNTFGITVDDEARRVINSKSFHMPSDLKEVDLVRISVADLGFTGATRYEAICNAAIRSGLALCTPEMGPQVQMQCNSKLDIERWTFIGMEILSGIGIPRPGIFAVALMDGEGDRGFLDWKNVYFSRRFSISNQFIFVKPRI